jgi:hypothetical protein
MRLAAWEVALRVAALALVLAIGTAWLGWWCVPVIAFAYAFMDAGARRRGPIAAGALVVGWGAMLLWDVRGSGLAGAERAAGVVGVPVGALALVTLVFGAVLAGCAAVLGSALRR